MRIKKVIANNRKKTFEIMVSGRKGRCRYDFPYSRLTRIPTESNPIEAVFPDEEIGRNGFTYRLASGKEDTILMDQVLEYARDPEYLRKLLLFKLTIQAQKKLRQLGVSKREVIRRMGATPTQFYRLMDQKNVHKTIDQMVKLLNALDCAVEIVFPPQASPRKYRAA